MPEANTCFVSYTHDSEEHRQRVLALADRLNDEGVDCDVDQYHEDSPPPKGWPLWMLDSVEQSKHVLLVCTKIYEERFRRRDDKPTGKGAKWEGGAITQELYEQTGGNTKFIPIVFDEADLPYIPLPLRSTTYYNVATPEGYDGLYRRLTGQPRVTKPALGPLRVMPSATDRAAKEESRAIQAAEGSGAAVAGTLGALGAEASTAGLEIATSRSLDVSAQALTEHAVLAASPAVQSPPVQENVLAPAVDVPAPMEHGSARSDAVALVGATVADHTWTALYGDGGCGKTQLAALFAARVGTGCTWLRLQGTDPQSARALIRATIEQRGGRQNDSFAAQCDAFCAGVGTGALIVLDDLPRLVSGDRLIEDLSTLARACEPANVPILSTSLHPLPPSLLNALGKHLTRLVSPRFNEQEAAELLQGQGAPAELLTPQRTLFLNGIAKGHPLLLAAIAQYLKSKAWKFTAEEVKGLFRDEHVPSVADEITPRLLAVVSPDARELLYRLNLIGASFPSTYVDALASVSPVISRPREVLQSLFGFCVQRDGSDRLAVAPPVQALGGKDLDAETRRRCHAILGELLVREGGLDQWVAGRAISHLIGGGEFNRAGALLLSGLHSLYRFVRRTNAAVGDFLLAFWAEVPLPIEMDLSLRLYIRGLQISIRHKLGQDVSFLLNDLEELISGSDAKAAIGVFAAAANAIEAAASKNVAWAFRLLDRAVTSIPMFGQEAAAARAELPRHLHPEYVVWPAVRWISEPGQLRLWTSTLEKLTPEQLEHLKRVDKEGDFSMSAATGLWLSESKRSTEQQRWPQVEQELADVAGVVKRLGLELLWANLIRGAMIVRAEYRKDLDGAMQIGHSALAVASGDPAVQFVLRECLGRELHFKNRHEEALPWLKSAIEQPTKLYDTTRMYATVHASISAGQNEPAAGLRFAEAAVDVMRGMKKIDRSSELAVLESIKILGELSLAQWLSGDLHACYLTLSEAAESLLALQSRGEDWKELFVLVGYAFGYLTPLALHGHPPDLNSFGEEYVAPYRGIFLTTHKGRAELYVKVKEALLRVHLAEFGGAVAEHAMATRWAKEGIEMARAGGPSLLMDLLPWHVVATEILENRFDAACQLGLEAAKYVAADRVRRARGENDIEANFDPDVVLRETDQQVLDDSYRHGTLGLMIGIASRLATITVSSPVTLQTELQRALEVCRRLANGTIQADAWRSFVEVIETTYSESATAAGLIKLGNESDAEEHKPVRIAAYFGATLKQRGGEPAEAVRAHLAVFPFMQEITAMFPGIYSICLDFISAYWGQQVQQSAFRFRSPRFAKQAFDRAKARPEPLRGQAILSAMADALGARVHPKSREWLQQVV